jgi:hypothetical protein
MTTKHPQKPIKQQSKRCAKPTGASFIEKHQGDGPLWCLEKIFSSPHWQVQFHKIK